MSQSRLRIFAGPNGSGKSTLFESFTKKYSTGFFLNPDLIQKELKTKGYIDLNDYKLNLSQNDLDIFLKSNRAKPLIKKSRNDGYKINFEIKENIIVDAEKDTHSYEGALISAFLGYELQKKGVDYCFETVMSHSSKIDDIIEAKRNNYKTYFYFICIDDPEVNISRIENRVNKGGHNVASDKVKTRYYNTLNNLIKAIELCNKCYLFDNSEDRFRLIAKINNDKLKILTEPKDLPNWFVDYVLNYYM